MAKESKLFQHALTSEEFKILTQVSKDVFFFANFIYVIHPVNGKTKFDLYPFQKSVLWHFINNRFNIILKFRQAGITELISMFCLWLAMYHPNKNIQIISIKDRVAKKVLRKIKYMYKNLPSYLQVPIVNGRTGEYGTAQEMEFSNGSLITSLPTTEEAGRSEALSLLVIDEAAIVRWASTIWAAAFPTLSTGGSAIVNSTPYGVGNWYHKTWVNALTKGNNFNAIRLYWWMHPERDRLWYEEMAAALGPRRTAQEIDGDFLTSGNSVFDLLTIRAIEESLGDYEIIDRKLNGNLLIFERPKRGEHYFIGSDVSTGRSRDYSSFTIMDRAGDEKAVFKGKIPVSKLASLLGDLGKRYNWALVAPESNDIGLSVTTKLQDEGYRNLYYAKKFLRKKGKKRTEEEDIPGWTTTRKNRPVIIDGLEEDIRNDVITIKDPFFVNEAYTFIYDSTNRPVAMNKDSNAGNSGDEEEDEAGYTDDAIMGKAITNHIRKSPLRKGIILPK